MLRKYVYNDHSFHPIDYSDLILVYKKGRTFLWRHENGVYILTHKHYFSNYEHYMVDPDLGKCYHCLRKVNKKLFKKYEFLNKLGKL